MITHAAAWLTKLAISEGRLKRKAQRAKMTRARLESNVPSASMLDLTERLPNRLSQESDLRRLLDQASDAVTSSPSPNVLRKRLYNNVLDSRVSNVNMVSALMSPEIDTERLEAALKPHRSMLRREKQKRVAQAAATAWQSFKSKLRTAAKDRLDSRPVLQRALRQLRRHKVAAIIAALGLGGGYGAMKLLGSKKETAA
jgi:hypothetical protein